MDLASGDVLLTVMSLSSPKVPRRRCINLLLPTPPYWKFYRALHSFCYWFALCTRRTPPGTSPTDSPAKSIVAASVSSRFLSFRWNESSVSTNPSKWRPPIARVIYWRRISTDSPTSVGLQAWEGGIETCPKGWENLLPQTTYVWQRADYLRYNEEVGVTASRYGIANISDLIRWYLNQKAR